MLGVGKHIKPAGWLRMGPCLPTHLHLRFLSMWLITNVKTQLALNSFFSFFLKSSLKAVSVFVYYPSVCVCGGGGNKFPGNLNFNITHDRHLPDKY